ncbi:uncharacterized protein LOC131016380 isoform X2 [Salvia miltiorrhiza]|uniref:uncharacterized protein LOC131016380 isoform X2 n=1 Tax=Salvia miltiorrhiza TaxID=226208 RepID=UPI0025AB770D|nr:uncharacterized protein LOC131016380 isoform X2 [Salvia miltiorrhiza]
MKTQSINKMEVSHIFYNSNPMAMDSTSEIGALIIEAAATGDLPTLWKIKKKVDDDQQFRRICDEYSDFSTGRNVLHHAAEVGHFDICRFLIKIVKVYINAWTYKRDTPLIEAAKGEHVKLVEYLIKQGASISSGNSKGYTALHYAVLKDNRELMKLLVIKGARIDADSMEGTPLQIASSRGNVEIVKFLLSHDAMPNLGYLVWESPLVCAIKSHSFECMDALLKVHRNHASYFIGFSPLSYAAKEGNARFLKSLLDAGADPNSPFTGHVKPIEDAALAHNRECVEILLPVTEPIEHYPEWTVDCIMEYCDSELAKTKREDVKSQCLTKLIEAAETAMDHKNYPYAVVHFTEAKILDPSNPKWASKRSVLHAHADRRLLALYDAEECVRLEPRFPDPHHGEGTDAAAQIFKYFFNAGLDFMVDFHNKKTADAFSPEEICEF